MTIRLNGSQIEDETCRASLISNCSAVCYEGQSAVSGQLMVVSALYCLFCTARQGGSSSQRSVDSGQRILLLVLYCKVGVATVSGQLTLVVSALYCLFCTARGAVEGSGQRADNGGQCIVLFVLHCKVGESRGQQPVGS